MTLIPLIALVFAFVFFVIAALGTASRFNLIAAGLACVVVSMLAGHMPL